MADIVLKDRNGNSIEYPGVNNIKVKTTDGATRDFVDSETVPEVVETTIDLDDESTNFANGAVEVTPDNGTMFNKVNIPVPANLKPENIAEGVDIAGIIGTLAAGGGGNVKIASGKTPSTGGIITVEHNLGVIPDIVYIWITATAENTLVRALGLSDALANIVTPSMTPRGNFYQISGKAPTFTYASIEVSTSGPGIHNATDSTFTIGSSTYPVISQLVGWFAIGGLT